ncbi:hypothetical protein A6R68_02316, partial [Neotoma lepida]
LSKLQLKERWVSKKVQIAIKPTRGKAPRKLATKAICKSAPSTGQALCEIRLYPQSTELLIGRFSFQYLLLVLCRSTNKAKLVGLYENTNPCTVHAICLTFMI